jgi:hypothetical protein
MIIFNIVPIIIILSGGPVVSLSTAEIVHLDDSDDSAVAEIKKAFSRQGLDAKMYGKEFDPKETEPLLLQAAWDTVSPEVVAIISRHLNSKAAPSISLSAEKVARENHKTRVIFLVGPIQRERVISLLMKATELERDRFPKYAPVAKAIFVTVPALKDEYTIDGNVNTTAISDALVKHIQDSSVPLKALRLTASKTILDKEKGSFQLLTSPVRIKDSPTEKLAYFWRIHARLDTDTDAPKNWLLTLRIDVGNVPLSNVKDLTKINFRALANNTLANPDYRKIIVDTVSKNAIVRGDGEFVMKDEKGQEVGRLVSLRKLSTIGDIIDVLHEECQKLLLKDK